jgi:16S rRNA (guanine1516-N2)-methyltransferase
VAVQPLQDTDVPRAAAVAAALELSVLPGERTAEAGRNEFDLLLLVDGTSLALQVPGAGGPVRVDFGNPSMRHRRRGGHNELLGRAVGVGRRAGLSVLDATAGLGRDAFVLADLGCVVHLYERHPVLQRLLQSGLETARNSTDAWLQEVSTRMVLHAGDAAEAVLRDGDFDVLYLDPMFPPRTKSAAVRKEMALFQRLLSDQADDAGELLRWALDQPVARVVVKRPARAEALGGIKPSHSIGGKAVRFDVHVLRALG